jgi:diguanylate cyclase
MGSKRYREQKERSAELLRLALAHMGKHAAAFNPVTFALWYEYVAGINPMLKQAIDQQLADSTSLDDTVVAQLHAAHIAPADEDTMSRISTDIQRVMAALAATASQTGSQAGAYGAQLSGLSSVLGQPGTGDLAPYLSEVVASTADMQRSVDALQQRVAMGESEILKLREDLDRACHEALRDPLTGLMNRKGFDQRIAALFSTAPGKGEGHFVVMLDIDHFKNVNDTHGHVIGDQVIQGVADILRGTVTNPAHSATRYGGEEFALLMPQSTRQECTRVAETIRARVKAMRTRSRKAQGEPVSVTISGGMAEWQARDDATSLIMRADAALYRSKSEGRDRLTVA